MEESFAFLVLRYLYGNLTLRNHERSYVPYKMTVQTIYEFAVHGFRYILQVTRLERNYHVYIRNSWRQLARALKVHSYESEGVVGSITS